MTTLTGRSPGNTYKDLLQVSNSNSGVDATLRDVEDGEGTASALQVSTTEAKVNGDLTVTGSVSLSTGLPVSSGGTGSTTEAGARIALGLAIGTDVQAYDAGLADIAGLAVTDGNIIVGDGANWVAESGAAARASLGLGIGVQAYDSNLTSFLAAHNLPTSDGTNGQVLTTNGGGAVSWADGADYTPADDAEGLLAISYALNS
jgi:hypothetical protein